MCPPPPPPPETDPIGIIECPKCGIPMRQLQLDGLVVDRCEQCLGIWLDRGEKARLLADRKVLEVVDIGAEEHGRWLDGMTEVNCPRCRVPLGHFVHPRQRHVGFEHCRLCGGSFFDAGELTDLSRFTMAERIKAFLHLGTDVSGEPG